MMSDPASKDIFDDFRQCTDDKITSIQTQYSDNVSRLDALQTRATFSEKMLIPASPAFNHVTLFCIGPSLKIFWAAITRPPR